MADTLNTSNKNKYVADLGKSYRLFEKKIFYFLKSSLHRWKKKRERS